MANNQLVGANTRALALTGTSDVSDEVNQAGMSFGQLVKLTGKAVGDTQLRLNQTGAATASVLAGTQVDVIAVQESIYDDQGNLTEAKSHTRRLPLLNFIDPVFYEWKEVRLRGQFFANEFVSSNEKSSSTSSSSSDWVGSGISFVLGPGGMTFKSKSTSTTSDVDRSADTSYGRIRASALLAPKRDVGVPKPRQVVRAPSLTILAGEIQDEMNGSILVGRTMSALIELRRMDGTPIAGKALSIETEGVPWEYTTPGADETDSEGHIAITLSRSFLSEEADQSPINVVVSARLGLVANSTTLTF